MNGTGKGSSVVKRYESESQRYCGKCYAPAFTHVEGIAVCVTNAKAAGVI